MQGVGLIVVCCFFMTAHSVIQVTFADTTAYTMECEQLQYNVSEGRQARVCLKFAGPLTMDTDVDDVVVAGQVTTNSLTAEGDDLVGINVSFTQTVSPSSRGLLSLPCVGVFVPHNGVQTVRVMILQSEPLKTESTCTVRILDRRPEDKDDTPFPPECGGTPQPQASVGGAVAGGVIGSLLGLAFIAVVIVLLVYFLFFFHKKPVTHASPEHIKNGFPRSVVYKKNGDIESSVSDGTVRPDVETTPTRKREPRVVPMDNPNYVNEVITGTSPESEPTSPIYGNVEREDDLVVSITEPEAYEVPVSLTNQNADETPQVYEVPIPSRSNSDGSVVDTSNHYHTLEPPNHYHTLEAPGQAVVRHQ